MSILPEQPETLNRPLNITRAPETTPGRLMIATLLNGLILIAVVSLVVVVMQVQKEQAAIKQQNATIQSTLDGAIRKNARRIDAISEKVKARVIEEDQ